MRKKAGGFNIFIILLILVVLLFGGGCFFFLCVLKKSPDSVQTEWKRDFSEDEMERKFYYASLSEEGQDIYRILVSELRKGTEEIRLETTDGDLVSNVLKYILYDFPEFFWCDGSSIWTAYEGEENYMLFAPTYLYDEAERTKRQKEIDAVVQQCLSGIAEDADEYSRIQYVFEYLVDTVDYDSGAEDKQNIYSALVSRRSVCAGYTRATQYLLEKLGVFCTYVYGKAESPLVGNGDHAWNLVLCDGDYYYVDTTWGDPLFMGGTEEGQKNNICYDYLCCNDEELFKTHTPDPDLILPKCTKIDANYYVVNGMYYTEYDSESIFNVMLADIHEGKEQSIFKFADSNVYRQAYEDIFGNLMERAMQEVLEEYQLQQGFYQYVDDDQLNKIIIYWEYE